MADSDSARSAYTPEVVEKIIARTASAYQTEIARRHLIQKGVKVFHVAAKSGGASFAGGTVLVLTGVSNSKHFAEIIRAAESGDAVNVSNAVSAFERYLQESASQAPARPQTASAETGRRPNADETASRIAAIPQLHQITYRGRIVADGLPVDTGHELSLARLPYTGARLDPAGFHVNEFHASKRVSLAPTETVVIAREPVLTEVEKNILAKIPADLSQVGLGTPGTVENWGLLAAGVALAAVYFIGTYLAQKAKEAAQEQQQEAEKQMGQNVGVQQDQGQQAQDQQQAQQDQGQQQQDQGQQQQDQGQQGQGQQDQGQQDQGQGQQQANGGDLSHWLNGTLLETELQDIAALAAVDVLLQLRSQLLMTGRIG